MRGRAFRGKDRPRTYFDLDSSSLKELTRASSIAVKCLYPATIFWFGAEILMISLLRSHPLVTKITDAISLLKR